MTITKAILTIDGAKYDILNFNYGFQRDTDAKGRPWSSYYGGSIIVQIESSEDVTLFRNMTHKDMLPVKGSIEVFSSDDYCVRRIEFEKAYLYSLGEEMRSYSGMPMITTIGISPMRLEFNDLLKIDRRWPEYRGWEKAKEEEVKYAKASTTPNARIIDAYWIDKKGRQKRNLYTKRPVKLYLVLENYVQGATINFNFEDTDREGWSASGYSGVVKQDGIVEIEDFQLKPKNKNNGNM